MIFYWISFYFIFLKRNNKKCFSLWYLICSFKKKFWRYDLWKIQKKKEKKNAQKTSLSLAAIWIAFLAWKTLKFGFLYLYKSCTELNFHSKNINPKSMGIFSSKLWPKYETDAEDNINSTLSSIFSQNFKWGSAINLFKPI